jgi:hypothetical protein
VEIVGQLVEAFNRLEVAALIEIAATDIEFETLSGIAVTSIVYRGHAGL